MKQYSFYRDTSIGFYNVIAFSFTSSIQTVIADWSLENPQNNEDFFCTSLIKCKLRVLVFLAIHTTC